MQQLVRNNVETGLVETAQKVLPAGTFGNTALDVVIARGKAGRIWDVSGNEYIDYLLGSGPMLVGHAHPEVTAAVQAQVIDGTTFFVNNPHGIRLANEIVDAIPCAEQVRFVCTGTEADLYAMRVARAYKKRDKILKFEGGYHGMSDYSLMSLAPKRLANFPTPVPDSAGIPKSVRDDIVVAPFNDLDAVKSLVAQHKDELAAIIVEPFQRLIAPKPGFLEGLRKLTEETGIVLIFDEVVTGFRWHYSGAQAYYGVTPDLATFGKVIGGGFPLAAIAGREDIMRHFNKSAVPEDEFLVQIGTLSGNPVASAAGLATMEILKRPGAYDQLFATGNKLKDALGRILKDARIPAQIIGEAPMFDACFTDTEVTDYRGYFRGNQEISRRFNAALLKRGILKSDGKYYISLAHDEKDVAHTISSWEAAARELKDSKVA
ncbi:MAG TPA: aminotransferase class III-fold pyridoxal phosphate-dependent enzyme [Hyphomicrobiaceae bacterium]|nr:aminotransferase class III-fold pyridoxal phosphate-dependent enzyme [Hyphomicrobiaceae bacterium]